MGEEKEKIRKEVIEFANEMERVLRENDHKTGWDDMRIHRLFNRIKQEFEELQTEYIIYNSGLLNPEDQKKRIQKMRKETIDIANFCMFLCHNYPRK